MENFKEEEENKWDKLQEWDDDFFQKEEYEKIQELYSPQKLKKDTKIANDIKQ